MVLGVGLQSEATIKLKVELDSRGINGVKTLLRDLTNAMNAQKAVAQLDLFEKNLIDIQKQAAKTTSELKKTQAVVAKLAKDAQKMKSTPVVFSNWSQATEAFAKRLSQLERNADAAFRASYRLQMVGSNLQRFSDMIVGVGQDIMSTFGDFEFMMNRARGALSLFSGAELDGEDATRVLTFAITDLSKELRMFKPEEVAQGLYFWGSATGQVVKTVDDLNVAMSAIAPIMQTAAMTNTDYETTIKGVYSILTQFYAGALDRAEEVTQKLFYTTQTTAAEFGDLIQSFKMVGPVAAQAGASFDEVNEALGKLADLGIRGSMSGRALRQFFIQMMRPSGPAKKAMDDLFGSLSLEKGGGPFGGKTFMEVAFPEGEFVGIEEHINALAKATMNLTSLERNRFLAQISTANELPILVALLAQERRELLGLAEAEKEYASSAEKARMFFQKNWELLAESWNATVGSVQRSIESLKITIGATLADTLRPLMDMIAELVGKFEIFLRQNPEIVDAVGRLTTALAVGAGLAGALFTVAGALVGLASAMYVAINLFKGWWGAISRVVGVFGLLLDAIVSNFDYLYRSGNEIVRNLTAAFENLGAAGIDLAGVLETITRPARELAGLLVRVIADIAVGISQFVRAVSEIPIATAALQALVAVLTLLVGARIAAGVLALAKALTLLTVALSRGLAAGLVGIGKAIFGLGKAVGAAGLLGGLKGLGAALTGLVGGPLALAGLGVTIGFLAYDLFPPFRDAIDAVAGAFENLDAKVARTVESLGESGPRVQASIIRFQGLRFDTSEVDRQIDVLNNERESLLAKINAKPPQEAFGDKDKTFAWLDSVYGTTDQDAINKQIEAAESRVKVITDKITELGSKSEGLAAAGIKSQQATLDAINKTFENYTLAAATVGREAVATRDEFMQSVIQVSERSPNVDPAVIAQFVSSLLFFSPDQLTAQEFNTTLQKVIRQNPLFANIDTTSVANILGDRIGQVSKTVDVALEKYISQAMSIQDPEELGRFLTQLVPGYQQSLAEMITEPKYAAIAPMIELQFQRLAELEEDWASGNAPMREIEQRITDILTGMINDSMESVTPTITELSGKLLDLSVWGEQNYDEMAQALLDAALPDGEKLLSAIKGGSVNAGAAGTKLLEMASFLAEAGYGGNELAAIVGVEAEEAARKTRRSMVEGLVNGLGSGALLMKDVREAMKKGSTANQLMKMARELIDRPIQTALSGKGSNIQTKLMARERISEIIDTVQTSIDRAMITGGGRKEAKKWFTFFRNNWDDMPKAARRAAMDIIDDVSIDFPGLWDEVFANSGRGGGRRKPKRVDDDKNNKNPITAFIDDTINAVQTSPLANSVSGLITSIANTGIANVIPKVIDSAKEIGNSITSGIKQGAVSTRGTVVAGTQSAISGVNSAPVKAAAMSRGIGVGQAITAGIAAGMDIQAIIDKLNAIKAVAEGDSPPKKGPLKDIDKGAYNIGAAWGEGLGRGMRDSTGGLLDFIDGTNARPSQLEVNDRKEVILKIDVTSSDGSVDRMKRADVRKAAMEAIAMADLEHYVTIG